jgi:hypothetical protein
VTRLRISACKGNLFPVLYASEQGGYDCVITDKAASVRQPWLTISDASLKARLMVAWFHMTFQEVLQKTWHTGNTTT